MSETGIERQSERVRHCVCESVRHTGDGKRRCSHSETLSSSSQTAYSICLTIVRRLRTRFEKNGDTADKSTKFFPQVLHTHTFQFRGGST